VFLSAFLLGGAGLLRGLTGRLDWSALPTQLWFLGSGILLGLAGGYAAWLIAGAVERETQNRIFARGQALAVLGAAVLLVLLYWLVRPDSRRAGPRPETANGRDLNVILVTVDALRADHLSCYGYGLQTSPHIDSLARAGVRFATAYSTAPFTTPSMASFLTGLYPPRHGVRTLPGFLAPENLTLAEVLRDHGYATAAITANPILDDRWGFGQGFDDFEVRQLSSGNRFVRALPLFRLFRQESKTEPLGGKGVTESALRWIDGHRGRRFFLWLHYMDVHGPEKVPLEFVHRYLPNWGHRDYPFARMIEQGKQKGTYVRGILRGPFFTPRQWSDYLGFYDASISYVDWNLARIVERVDRLGLSGKTVLIVSADHGESLGEHNQLQHGISVYESAVRIPLVFCGGPFTSAHPTVAAEVSAVDVFPTVLEALGLPRPPGLDGHSLLPLVQGEIAPDERRVLHLESEDNSAAVIRYYPNRLSGVEGKSLAVCAEGWKLIYSPRWGDHEWELYDLQRDPGEQVNLFASGSTEARDLQSKLLSWMLESPRATRLPSGPAVDGDMRDRLKALGYID
jgi:arylsulfatase A-like enzyme